MFLLDEENIFQASHHRARHGYPPKLVNVCNRGVSFASGTTEHFRACSGRQDRYGRKWCQSRSPRLGRHRPTAGFPCGSRSHRPRLLAPQFTAHHHVYAITRRGFGASSKPAPTVANYSADRLGEDVLIVIQSLKLDHPVLVGHSIAGEELSWIGSQHPGEVAGLIYLDSVDSYSFYDPTQTDMVMDMVDLRRQIDAFQAGEPLSTTVLAQIRDSAAALAKSSGRMADNVAMAGGREDPAPPPVGLAMFFGKEKFTTVHAPMLAIMACPHTFAPLAQIDAKAAAVATDKDRARCTDQIQSLKAHVPSAQIVVLPNADHDIYHSNEADVVRAMDAFLAKLP
jgi:non-heme chloroperoxidase